MNFWKRFIAYLIDMIIINVIVVSSFRGLLKNIVKDKSSFVILDMFNYQNKELLLVSGIIALFTLIYWSVLEFKINQTIGKIIMNIKVVSDNKKSKYWQYLVRNLSKPFILILILDVLYMLISRDKRFFEKISNTKVIKNE